MVELDIARLGPWTDSLATLRIACQARGEEEEEERGTTDMERGCFDKTRAGRASLQALLKQWFEVLFQPVAMAVRKSPRLIIVPDQEMACVPWSALLAAADGRFIVQDHAVVVAPSVALLRATEPRPVLWHGGQALLVGRAMFKEEWHLRDLEHVDAEMEGVSDALRGAGMRVEKLSGAAAQKDLVLARLSTAHVAHAATHSAHGGLILGGREVLTAEDIVGLELKTEVVVLSACHTMTDRSKTSDLVSGLSRALLAAGVRFVVATLWKVSDRACCAFMRGFYAAWTQGDAVSEAVRLEASLNMLGDPNNIFSFGPQHWGGFVVVGGSLDMRIG